MKVKDKELWKVGKENNKDSYGARIYSYAEDWANLIENEMQASGRLAAEVIKSHAKKFAHEADYDGITGFMYNMAVNVLYHTWEYGDELRRWHNLECQIGTEGEKANESGGVLNSSIINISTD